MHIVDLNFQGRPKTIAAYLIPTTDGLVLVESGPHSTYPTLVGEIEHLGYQKEDVRHVLLTHIHFDHAGAAWEFAKHGATILVHPVGLPHLAEPQRLFASAQRIYGDRMDTLWGRMEPIPKHQLVAVQHWERYKIGGVYFRAIHTPGHAKHHLSWQMGNALFTGDAGGVRIPGYSIVVPPCPPPDIDIEAWLERIDFMKNRRFERLYLTHYGEVDQPKQHFIELAARLKNWSNWMKPYVENRVPMEQVIAAFKDFVHRQYTVSGLDQQGKELYELANPIDMNIAGLMRYWQQRIG